LNRRGKHSPSALPKASPAARFGISDDALAEIEETVYQHLDHKALRIECTSSDVDRSSPTRALLANNIAREAALQLRPLLTEAVCEYAEMLTRTILEHRGNRPDVHWKAIADQAVTFCERFALWENSARWLYGPLKAAGLDWNNITPLTKSAFLTMLLARTFLGPYSQPALSTEAEIEFVPELLRRKIRHIVRLAPDETAQAPPKLTEREKKMFDVILLGSRGMQYCRELENAGIRPRKSGAWKGAPGTYPTAYMDGEPWRHRIQDEKSRIERKAAGYHSPKVAKLADE